MRAPFRRYFLAFAIAGILVMSLAGIASAHVASKTIDTANGSATYDPTLGFTGAIQFLAGEGDINLSDFICENVRGVPGAFTSVGGQYTLTFYAPGDLGGTPLGSWTYTIASGIDCTDGNTQVVFPIAFHVGGVSGDPNVTVLYSLVAPNHDYTNDNSILNRIEEQGDGHANSPSVGPPGGPPPVVPEAPFTILLLGTGALTSVWYVSRKLRQSVSLTAA
jgi:hypothetical protein